MLEQQQLVADPSVGPCRREALLEVPCVAVGHPTQPAHLHRPTLHGRTIAGTVPRPVHGCRGAPAVGVSRRAISRGRACFRGGHDRGGPISRARERRWRVRPDVARGRRRHRRRGRPRAPAARPDPGLRHHRRRGPRGRRAGAGAPAVRRRAQPVLHDGLVAAGDEPAAGAADGVDRGGRRRTARGEGGPGRMGRAAADHPLVCHHRRAARRGMDGRARAAADVRAAPAARLLQLLLRDAAVPGGRRVPRPTPRLVRRPGHRDAGRRAHADLRGARVRVRDRRAAAGRRRDVDVAGGWAADGGRARAAADQAPAGAFGRRSRHARSRRRVAVVDDGRVELFERLGTDAARDGEARRAASAFCQGIAGS